MPLMLMMCTSYLELIGRQAPFHYPMNYGIGKATLHWLVTLYQNVLKCMYTGSDLKSLCACMYRIDTLSIL